MESNRIIGMSRMNRMIRIEWNRIDSSHRVESMNETNRRFDESEWNDDEWNDSDE